MKKMKEYSKIMTVIIAFAFIMFACVDDDFDTPPIKQIPTGDVLTIENLKTLFADSAEFLNTGTGDAYLFDYDASIYGTVTMDNETDNSYRTFYIQDNSGAIAVYQDVSGSIYIGDSVRIYLKDLVVMQYSGLFQLNSKIGDGVNVDSNIVKMGFNVERNPEAATIDQILSNKEYYQGRLVKISDVQFVDTDTSKTFADPSTNPPTTKNTFIQDSEDNQIIVRTSGYANFAGADVPDGSGSLIAIVGQFNDDMQLSIRKLGEVEMDNARFDVDGSGGGGGTTIDPVASVNEDFSSAEDYTDIALTGWTNIAVQGDRKWQGKVFNSEKYIQASGYNSGLAAMETWIITPPVTGISSKVLSFKSAKAYWAHDAGEKPLRVYISTDFTGDNFETASWNELNVTVAGESDADHAWIESGEVDLSAYSGNAAIAFKYVGSDTESTTIRLDDIMVDVSGGGGGTTDPVTAFNIDFSQFANYDDVVIDGWQSFAETGSRLWQAKEFSGNVYAQGSAYNSTDAENIEWLITPPIDFDVNANEVLHFRSAVAYYTHEAFDLLISTDYDGTNYATATWTSLTATIAGSSNSDYEWVNSGDIDLSSYTGIGYIAFKYTGDADQSQTGTFILDDIVLENK